jgi:hypothetical protein
MEAMVDAGADEENAARAHLFVLLTGLESPAAAHNVVDLVLVVGTLEIRLAGGQTVDAAVEAGNAEKLAIGIVGKRRQLVQMKVAGRRRAVGFGGHNFSTSMNIEGVRVGSFE